MRRRRTHTVHDPRGGPVWERSAGHGGAGNCSRATAYSMLVDPSRFVMFGAGALWLAVLLQL